MTFINVEPYVLEDVDGQLQPVLDANQQLQAAPATDGRASCRSRSSSWSTARRRPRLVRGLHREASWRRRWPRSAEAGPALLGVLEADATRSPSCSGTRRGSASHAMCSPRWAGGNSAPFSSVTDAEYEVRPSGVRSVKPRTSVRPSESIELDHDGRPPPAECPGRGRSPPNTAAEPATATTITASATTKSRNVPRSMRVGPSARGRAGARAPRCVERGPGRALRARARTRLERRQVELPERTERVGTAGPRRRQRRRGRRCGRRGRRTRRSRRPSSSTAGIIASSDPPVVRMSSTSSTRSPGSIRNPRRNSRWVRRRRRGPPPRRSTEHRAGGPSRTRG